MKSPGANYLKIKLWSAEDQPREKLRLHGAATLSDAELIAILLGSGTSAASAVEVARHLLQSADNDLNVLARFTIKDLEKVKGVGNVKAIAIQAAMEMGRRRRDAAAQERPRIITSGDAFEQVRGNLMDLTREEFWVLLLNRAGRLIRKQRISEGGVSATHVDPKIIFKLALEELATSIVVAHNHPSGNLAVSQSDLELTKKLSGAGKLLEIQVVDHIIVAGWNYYSFADDGLL